MASTLPTHVLLLTGSRDWDDREAMLAAFRQVWQHWGPREVTHPLLVVGDCPTGADAMARDLFSREGLPVEVLAADWSNHGPRAGMMRNQDLVDHVVALHGRGARVHVAAFLRLCTQPGCRRPNEHQLLPDGPRGHFSHGTIHCRSRARAAGLEVLDVPDPRLPPF